MVPAVQPQAATRGLRVTFRRHRGKLLVASVFSAGIGYGLAALMDSNLIDAESDTRILAACPQMQDVKTVRLYAGDISYNFGGRRVNIIGHIKPRPQPNMMRVGFGMTMIFNHRPDPHSMRFRTLHRAPQNVRLTYNINSPGGEFRTSATYAHLINKSEATVVTNVEKIAASGASLMAFAGTEGHRWISSDALVVLHAARGILPAEKVKPGETRLRFEEDYPVGSKERNAIAEMNGWLRQKYREFSSTGISVECVDAIIRGKDDISVAPHVALRFGWTDAVKEIGWYSGEYTGYITVRANDPRAIGRTQPLALEARAF